MPEAKQLDGWGSGSDPQAPRPPARHRKEQGTFLVALGLHVPRQGFLDDLLCHLRTDHPICGVLKPLCTPQSHICPEEG